VARLAESDRNAAADLLCPPRRGGHLEWRIASTSWLRHRSASLVGRKASFLYGANRGPPITLSEWRKQKDRV